jgi:uncharacterized protein (DUF2235 family)
MTRAGDKATYSKKRSQLMSTSNLSAFGVYIFARELSHIVDAFYFRDTVCSVGILSGRRLPFTASNNHIRFFRHAISLDERRARFKVNLWHRPTEEDHKKVIPKGTMPRHKTPSSQPQGDTTKSAKSDNSHKKSLNDLEREFTDSDRHTDVEEVWFSHQQNQGHLDSLNRTGQRSIEPQKSQKGAVLDGAVQLL